MGGGEAVRGSGARRKREMRPGERNDKERERERGVTER